MKILYQMNQRQRLKTMSTPLPYADILYRRWRAYQWRKWGGTWLLKQCCEMLQKPVCKKHSHKTSGVTCNNCKDGPLTSSTVAVDACYILLASQQFRCSKIHGFELQSYNYFTLKYATFPRNKCWINRCITVTRYDILKPNAKSNAEKLGSLSVKFYLRFLGVSYFVYEPVVVSYFSVNHLLSKPYKFCRDTSKPYKFCRDTS